MRSAQQVSGQDRFVPEEELMKIEVLTNKVYPGRTFEELSSQEKESIFRAYESERDSANALISQGQRMMEGAGKEVGPLNVYTSNPWDALGGAVMSGAGQYMRGKANQGEAEGREVLADLQTNRDARDTEAYNAEERRRREWLAEIFGR